MSKNYDLYPSYERKIDNWRRRIIGYEKMERDLQRQIQILKNKNHKLNDNWNKLKEYITENNKTLCWTNNYDDILGKMEELQGSDSNDTNR